MNKVVGTLKEKTGRALFLILEESKFLFESFDSSTKRKFGMMFHLFWAGMIIRYGLDYSKSYSIITDTWEIVETSSDETLDKQLGNFFLRAEDCDNCLERNKCEQELWIRTLREKIQNGESFVNTLANVSRFFMSSLKEGHA